METPPERGRAARWGALSRPGTELRGEGPEGRVGSAAGKPGGARQGCPEVAGSRQGLSKGGGLELVRMLGGGGGLALDGGLHWRRAGAGVS